MKRQDATSLYIAAHGRFLRAARLYTHAFDRFADGDCTDLELARTELELDRAAKDVVSAAADANREIGSVRK